MLLVTDWGRRRGARLSEIRTSLATAQCTVVVSSAVGRTPLMLMMPGSRAHSLLVAAAAAASMRACDTFVPLSTLHPAPVLCLLGGTSGPDVRFRLCHGNDIAQSPDHC